MAKLTTPIKFIAIKQAKNKTYSWSVVDRRRKTGSKDNTVYSSHSFDTKSNALRAARKHNETLKVKLEIVDISKGR